MIPRGFGRLFTAACVILFCLLFAGGMPAQAQAEPSKAQPAALWQEVSDPAVLEGLAASEQPDRYRALALNGSLLAARLEQAPAEFSGGARPEVVIELPLPDGGFGRFSVVHSPVMAADLAARYPEIQSYAAQGVDNPTQTARLAWTPNGLNAIILGPDSIYYVAPYAQGNNVYHVSFDGRDVPNMLAGNFHEAEHERLALGEGGGELIPEVAPPYSVGSELRLYRLAITTSGEYVQAHGGTVAGALASIVTEVNEANAVFERELAMRFVLVSNNDALIFTDPATDPIAVDDCESTYLGVTQATIDSIIGSANYDHGQLFLLNYCGGIVGGRLGNPASKAHAQSGQAGGSSISLAVFAHEVGHGMNAIHTWSRCNGATGGQFDPNSAYEPGSGNTLQSYAGICGVDNVGEQLYQYHSHSFDDMIEYLTTDPYGSAAGYVMPTDNSAPVVEAGSSGFTWPTNTPFVLAGSASDAEGDTLTYSWEEYDLASPDGEAPNSGRYPFFRVFAASETGNSRTFPQLSDVVNNTVTLGEFLAPMTTTVTMNFRLHTWDNHAGAGGVAYDSMSITFSNTAGPFLVTSPNSGTEVWPAGSGQTVTWDVANTNVAPVNCSTVNIDLSVDGGYTYPYNLATGTANDGTENVTMPAGLQTPTARIRVACASLPDHFFFDISNANFTVGAGLPTCVPGLVVQNTADSGPCSLRDTISAATAGSTITFDPALTGHTIRLASIITITKNLIIDGSTTGVIVSGDTTGDGTGDTRVFGVTGGGVTVQFNNFTIEHGRWMGTNFSDYGAGIRLEGANLTLNNMTLRNNLATFGGGIFQWSGTLTVNDSSFSSNSGGGGAIYKQQGTATVNRSTFDDNSSAGVGAGGAIRMEFGTTSDSLTINNSTFSGNRALTVGGAIYNGSQTLTIRNSTFSGNSAVTGGGIRNVATLNLSNTIVANSPSGGDCSDGGTISTNIRNLIEDGSCSPFLSGDPQLAALAYNGGSTQTFALAPTSPAVNQGDSATCGGASIANLDQRNYTRPTACDIGAFEYDASYSAGGNSQPSIDPDTFSVDEYAAIGTVVGTASSSDPDAGQTLTYKIAGGNTGNAFQINSSTGEITVRRWQPLYYPTNSQFQLLVEVVDDGSPQLYDSAIITINVNDINLAPSADNATWTILSSTANGTFLDYVRANDPDPNDRLTFAITAGNAGGVFNINANNGDITVANNSDFGSNPTYNLTVQVTDNGSPNQNDTATITIQVIQCTVGLVTSTADSGPCTLRQAITDVASGGTIRFGDNIAGQTIRLASTIAFNKSLTIDGASQNITISGDSDNNGTPDTGILRINGGTVNINHLRFERGNGAAHPNLSGGAIYSTSNLTLNNCVFANNAVVSDGSSFADGGALVVAGGSATINDCTFSNNSAYQDSIFLIGGAGGAVATYPSTSVTINNSTFAGNTSSSFLDGGGAVMNNGTATINNSTFYNNQAVDTGLGWAYGGGGVLNYGTLTVRNSTFSANGSAAYGGAISNVSEFSSADLLLYNSILANSVGADDCYNDTFSGATVSANVQNLVGSSTDCGTPAYTTDPNLASLLDNDGPTATMALQSPSDAIDNGDNAACAAATGLDQRGYLRDDGSCDIGAYEYNASPGTAVWDGGGSTSNWSEAANWSGDVAPAAGSTVVFNSTSLKNATVDADFGGTVAAVILDSGYTGAVTLGRSLAVNGNLSVANGATLNLSDQTLTVEGTVTNNGRLSQILPATSVGVAVNFLRITNAAATSTKYWGVDITPTASSLGSVIVTVLGNQSRCTGNGNDETVKRCFEINPTTSAASTIRLYFQEAERDGQSANQLRVYHHNGAAWMEETTGKSYSETDIICLNQNGQACWVQVQNVTGFSPFILGSGGTPSTPGTPTAISFADLNFKVARPVDLVWLVVSLLTLTTILAGVWRKYVIREA